jgi:hypothetical protein
VETLQSLLRYENLYEKLLLREAEDRDERSILRNVMKIYFTQRNENLYQKITNVETL